MPLEKGMVMEISYGYILPRPCSLLPLLAQEAIQSCHFLGDGHRDILRISPATSPPPSLGAPPHRYGHGDILRIPPAAFLPSFTTTGAGGSPELPVTRDGHRDILRIPPATSPPLSF